MSYRIAIALVPLLACQSLPPETVVIPEGAEVRQLATGMGFVEGPVWSAADQALVFSDIPNARLMRWSADDGLSVYRPSESANGNLLDQNGRLLSCQHAARNIVRQEDDGSLTVLVDRFEGKRFNSPNDLAVQSDGVIWFTDPPWGLEKQREGKELSGHWVFRFDPASGDVRAVLTDRCMPNGIALSPDQARLYVADTGGHPSHPDAAFHDMPATLSAYVLEHGEIVSTEPVWRVETVCDGMCVDERGNVYASGTGGITIWSPSGEPVAEIATPEQPANACFGGADGRTLFITARTSLYAIDLGVAGAAFADGHASLPLAVFPQPTALMSAHLTTATPDLESSEAHFTLLGFTKVSSEPVLYSDGKALVEIDPDRFARPGIKLYRTSWDDLLPELEGFGPLHAREGGRVIGAPSGAWVYLMDGAFDAPAETGQASVLGKYAGISLETTRMEDSQRFWELLGFEVSGGGADQGWLSLTGAGGFGISIMKPFSCPHLFVNPSLTYFNSGKNPEVIAEIRKREIPIAEEVTVFNPDGAVDNVILRESGGLGFFVFND